MKTDIRAAVGAKFVEACRVLLPGLAAFALIGAGARAETVDEIIVQNIQARGGLEKLKAIRTLRTTVKFSDGSFRAEFRQENKRPGKVREEFIVQSMAQIQAYDGKTGWQISPFSGRKDPDLMSQDDMKSLIMDGDMDGPLVDYKEKWGHSLLLSGYGFLSRAESGDSDHHPRRPPGIRALLRRLRAGEWNLLPVCGGTGAKGKFLAPAVFRRKDRTERGPGRLAFHHACDETGSKETRGWKIICCTENFPRFVLIRGCRSVTRSPRITT